MGKDWIWHYINCARREMMYKNRMRMGLRLKSGLRNFSTSTLARLFSILWGCAGHQIIITKDPLSVEEHIKLGQAYEIKGELELALQEYEKGLEKDNTNCMGYFGIGNIYYKKGNLSDAETFYKNLSWVYIEGNKDLKQAETFAQRALSLDPSMSFVYLDTLGVVYTRLNEFEKAEEALLSALKNAPDDKDALIQINTHLFELYEITG